MKVILIEDIKGTGKKGELVEVSDGYARNYLIRLNKAKVATKTEINNFKQQQQSEKFHEDQKFEDAKKQFEDINGKSVTLKAKEGESGKLFGSITSKAIADAVSKKFFKVDKKDIKIEEPIKELGSHQIELKLHKDITATITVDVKAEK